MEVRTSLRAVAAFRGPGAFLLRHSVSGDAATRDHVLSALDVDDPGLPEPIFTISTGKATNSGIGVSADLGSVYVTDGDAIHDVLDSGGPRLVYDIERLRSADERIGCDHRFSWSLSVSDDGRFLYGEVLPFRAVGPRFLARIDLAGGEPRAIELEGLRLLSLDTARGVAYEGRPRGPGKPEVLALGFDPGPPRRLEVDALPLFGALDPEGRRLVYSEWDSREYVGLHSVHLDSGQEERLPFEGARPAWSPDGHLYFLRGESLLWRWRPGTGAPEPVLEIPGEGMPGERWTEREGEKYKVSYGEAPVFSRDGRWLAWRATRFRDAAPERMILLADLERWEYRSIPGGGYAMAWARGFGAEAMAARWRCRSNQPLRESGRP